MNVLMKNMSDSHLDTEGVCFSLLPSLDGRTICSLRLLLPDIVRVGAVCVWRDYLPLYFQLIKTALHALTTVCE